MRSAISAGALALALGGGLSVVATASADAAHAADCDRGGGLLGGVTGGLCQTVDGVTNVVDGLTGSVLSPVTEGLDQTVGKVLEPVGEAAPTARASSGGRTTAPPSAPEKREEGSGGGRPPVTLDVCVSLSSSGCAESPTSPASPASSAPAPGEDARPTATAPADRSRRPETERPEKEQAPVSGPSSSASYPYHPEPRPHTTEVRDPALSEPPVIDVETPLLEPLWPGPLTQELRQRVPGGQASVTLVRSSDPVGTALTAVLLAAAVLAVRLMYTRRAEEESIPFEPLRMGRHRVA
ncbi:hypothetical protein ACFOWE_27670 [Planomonospora corallina]|uniref:Secreted protein n=1 Tax=Planomonospora corallina TaxID=1806052 RepID=A0ABV8ICZ6_9ACTN